MSFFASNNRIHITNDESKTIFDTDKPMPHIIGTVTGNVVVNFPAIGVNYWSSVGVEQLNSGLCGYTKLEYVCRSVYDCRPKEVCSNQWVCRQVYGCYPETVCGYKWQGGEYVYVCEQDTVCGYNEECGYEYVCETQNVCGYEQECGNEFVTRYSDLYRMDEGFDYTAKEWKDTIILGNVPAGLDADFLLVNGIANRTAQGTLADVGLLPCGLPLGTTFIANNSSIVECMSDIRNGNPWMTRIMSVFIESGQIKVQFKHSNRAFRSVSTWSGTACGVESGGAEFPPHVPGIPSPPTGASSYTFNLTIHLGKFTI